MKDRLALLLLAAPACAQSKDLLLPQGAPVYRFVPSEGWPYGPEGVHGAALPASEFAERRAAFLEEISRHGPGTVAIARSAPMAMRNGDVEHEYRQDSDFTWLTGFPEPEATAIFEPGFPEVEGAGSPSGERPVYTLIVRAKDRRREMWEGERIGPDRAMKEFGADRGETTRKTEELVREAISRAKTLVLVNHLDREFGEMVDRIVQERRASKEGAPEVVDGRPWIWTRRMVKSPAEIEMLRKAVEVTIEGHLAAMRASHPGMNEGEVEAATEFAFRALGSPRLGYPSICGGGARACVLHYDSNREFTGPNDLLLMDAGAEVGSYTADVTRTWPLSGTFTPEQRAIYEVVLRAQEAALEKVRPGGSFLQVQEASALEITRGLVRLGLLEGDPVELAGDRAYGRFFPHGTSHWLGLDVHDASGTRGGRRGLVPGMVFTVEPGIYIPEGMEGVDPKWWGIGVRIEDDVVVTGSGYENLSARLPRDPDEIESLVREGSAAFRAGGAAGPETSRRAGGGDPDRRRTTAGRPHRP
ncbi:MAG: aminopeptidase P family protein [Planctomycetes bacterium]|nr:aminopeptidase P family protein [Planctomycetota bacterium]